MAIDLTGGIDPAREYMFAERPEDPEMRDSVSFWVFDDRGQVGLPRTGVEAVAANWEEHSVQVNVAFPDGRVYRLREEGRSHEESEGSKKTEGQAPERLSERKVTRQGISERETQTVHASLPHRFARLPHR